MDIVSDTYIHGGIPQSRYCSDCAHYQALSGSSIDSNCCGSARVCLYILDTGHRRGCEPGPGAISILHSRSGARASAAAQSCVRSTAIAAPENGGQNHDD